MVDDAGAPDPLRSLLKRVHATLRVHQDELDALNVFPVPDGDTGSNLVRTVRAALDALGVDDAARRTAPSATTPDTGAADTTPTAPGDPADLAAAVRAAVDGAVRGARGNSGVIFSQVLRGWLESGLVPDPRATDLLTAARRARELGFAAVADPVRGTILTVLEAIERAAEALVDQADDASGLAHALVDAADEAVAATIDQLEVLRRAGKVDAGGRGLAVVLAAVARHLAGEDEPAEAPVPAVDRAAGATPTGDGVCAPATDGPRWEVMYGLAAGDAAVADLQAGLGAIGESVVVSSTGRELQVHVHTDHIGAAVEAGLPHGVPRDVRVEDLHGRAAEADPAVPHDPWDDATPAGTLRLATTGGTAEVARGPGAAPQPPSRPGPRPALGVVAVVPEGGVLRLATQLGAVCVAGASGDLPSVADLLNAVGRVDADRVVILPGHHNVVATAAQASRVSVMEGGREIDVVAAADAVPAVLAALSVLVPGTDAPTMLADLATAADGCRTGEVVAAVRDATTPAGDVRAGQFLAVVGTEVRSAHDEPAPAVLAVVRQLVGDAAELVTLVAGADAGPTERLGIAKALQDDADLPDGLEVEVLEGGQRPVRWFVGVE